MGITEDDVQRVASAASRLPAAKGNYLTDFVTNLLATVVDFQMQTTTVERALNHFKSQCWGQVRTFAGLQRVFARYADDQLGNTALAEYLWGYKLWTRAAMLRRLVMYFDEIGVRDQAGLHTWAANAEFKRDFEGRVKGLGPAVFQWLVMRQGVETVKPDVHVRRFAERVLGRRLSDNDLVEVVTAAARLLGLRPYELDWAIWEYQRALPPAP